MLYLTAAVILVGATCLTNLILSLGVIRRLREHADILERQRSGAAEPDSLMLGAGSVVGRYATATTGGETVSRESLAGQTLVGFFSPGCRACEERRSSFIDYAKAVPGGAARVLAVVIGSGADAADLERELAPVARVVIEDHDGAVGTAFGVRAYPAFILVNEDGVVTASSLMIEDLPTPVPA